MTGLAWREDGRTLVALLADGGCRLVTRSAARWTPAFPAPMESLGIPAGDDRSAVGAYRLTDGRPQVYNGPGAGSLVTDYDPEQPAVEAVRLSGDGRRVWTGAPLSTSRTSTERLDPVVLDGSPVAGRPVAVSPAGRVCAVRAGSELLVLGLDDADRDDADRDARSRPGPRPAITVSVLDRGPADTGDVDAQAAPVAVADSGRTAVAHGAGVRYGGLAAPAADVAVAAPVRALALDHAERRLAVVAGEQLLVWDVGVDGSAQGLGWYDSDRAEGADLLDRDRDVDALASLLASEHLVPPLSVGVFGDWGSGKTWFLRRLRRAVEKHTESGESGYLRNVVHVDFDAWHYAETDLMASLVDRVLGALTQDARGESEDVRAARTGVEQAEGELERARQDLLRRHEEAGQRRSRLWLCAAAGSALLAVVAALVLMGWFDGLLAAWSAAGALLAASAAAVQQARAVRGRLDDIASAGRAAGDAATLLAGRGETVAVVAAAERVSDAAHRLALAQERLAGLRADPLAASLGRIATVTEYKERLGLVLRTRERFGGLDEEVRAARAGYATGVRRERPVPERVVVTIDDLDRCPAEKVVQVLEAVHLLFDFELFVVLLAVDTRWLEQSLRIRYRELLGGDETAEPADYLEKIIQVPFHIERLDGPGAAALLAGLATPADRRGRHGADREAPAGSATRAASGEGPADERPAGAHPSGPDAATGGAGNEAAGTVPVPRGPTPPPGAGGATPAGTADRLHQAVVPATVLELTNDEIGWLTDSASLAGTTPRTIKRFLNTYRLLKARSGNPDAFARDPRAAAFLVALLTGQTALADDVLDACAEPAAPATLGEVLADVRARTAAEGRQLRTVERWLRDHAAFRGLATSELACHAPDVARFSFTVLRPPG